MSGLAIQQEALELLEWPRLAQHLAGFASTALGRQRCLALPLAPSPEASARLLAETTELIALDGLTEGGLSFQGVADFSRTLQICSKGGTASGDDLLAVATTLAAARRLRRQIDDPALRPVCSALVDDLRTLPELEQRLHFCVEESGRVADRASPALGELRRQLAASLEACTLSHEIRQPLSLLQLQCRQLMQRQEAVVLERSALRAELTAVAGTAEQINSTIVSMLSLLRSGTAIQEQLDLTTVVRAAITALRPRLEAASVRCLLEGLDHPAPLLGNTVQLRIACGNLLTNCLEALEARPPDQRRILVRLQRSGTASLILLVADSGPGLQGRSLQSLTLASSKSEGMGLGLFTTALIAEQHRGSLAAGSSPELGGAELRLQLPCLPAPPQPLLSSQTPRSGAATPPAPAQRR